MADHGATAAKTWFEGLPYPVNIATPVRDESGEIVDFRYTFANRFARELLEPGGGPFLGRTMHQRSGAGNSPEVVAICRLAIEEQREMRQSVPTVRGAVKLVALPIGDEVLIVSDEFDERTRSDLVAEQWRQSLESSSDSIAYLQPVRDEHGTAYDFVCAHLNERAMELIGWSSDAIGRTLRELMPDYSPALIAAYDEVIASGLPYSTEVEYGRAEQPRTLVLTTTKFREGVLAVTRDTTQQTRATRALARSEARFRGTVEALGDAVYVMSPVRDDAGTLVDLRLDYLNDEARQRATEGQAEHVGMSVRDMLEARETADLLERFLRVVETQQGETFESSWVDSTGHRHFVIRITPLDGGLLIVSSEITERQRQQARLAESEERYHLLADHAGDVVMYGSDGLLDWVAPSVEHLTGWKQDEVIGTRSIDLVHPDDQAVVLHARSTFSLGAPTTFRFRMRRRDGSYVWVDSKVRPVPDADGVYRTQAVSTIMSVQAEVEAQQALARAEEERREAEAQMHRATRLESLALMAGGIAHDFNNLLVGVLGNAEFALLELPADSPSREWIERITLAAQRAADLTRQLLDYTGSRAGPIDDIDVVSLVAETHLLIEARLPPATTVALSLPDASEHAGWTVHGDRSRLQQAVMNLVINASDALRGAAGTVRISVEFAEMTDHDLSALRHPNDLRVGPTAILSVVDDGVGMTEETIERVFEPFFTTRPHGRGLGLAVVHGVVRAHHGAIETTSAPGRGTTMTMYLPLRAPQRDGGALAAAVTASRPSMGVVLVVDDDDGVRQVSKLMLERAGLRVETAHSGEAGLELFAQIGPEVSCVLLDVTMPGMSGAEVFAAMRQVDAEVPIVLMSGYSPLDVQETIRSLDTSAYVKKPFRPADLIQAVRSSLRVVPSASS